MSTVDERSAPSTFRLSQQQLAELATGESGPGTVRFLADTQYSRRQLALLALRDLAVLDLGPLPPIDDAWAIMDRAKTRAPETFRSIIMYPQIGNWAAYAIREHSEDAGDENVTPAWIDFGQLHAVALVVAAGCGLTWRTRVPLRSGRAMLPGLGQASFDGAEPWDSAVAVTTAGDIRLSHGRTTVPVPANPRQDGDGWLGLRGLTAGSDPILEVVLDDLDPFRNLADPVEPERLTDDEVAGWQSILDGAWAILCHDDPATARAMAVAISSLSPLLRADQADDEEIRSASTAEAFGAVLLSTPRDVVDFAATLVHEYRHNKLGCLMHLCALHHEDEPAELYAPWRDDPRPIGGLIQGIYAFHGIAAFYRARIASTGGTERRTAQFAYALTHAQTVAGLASARASGGLTTLGREFFDGLNATMCPWATDELPASIHRLTSLALTAHRTTWLLRHRRPAPAAVDALVRCWSKGEPIDLTGLDAGTVEPADGPPPLTTTWIRPLRLAVNAPLPATTPETALAAGHPATAKERFVAGIAADPDDLAAWTGLALASLYLGDADAATALTDQPDLVRAGYRTLADKGVAPAPDVLAAWAGRTP